jgi:hypothetical protein
MPSQFDNMTCLLSIKGGIPVKSPNIPPRVGEITSFGGNLTIGSQCPITDAGGECFHPTEDAKYLEHDTQDGSVVWEDAMGIEHKAGPATGVSTLFPPPMSLNPRNSLHLQPVSIITSAGGWRNVERPNPPIEDKEEEIEFYDDDDGRDGSDGTTDTTEKAALQVRVK